MQEVNELLSPINWARRSGSSLDIKESEFNLLPWNNKKHTLGTCSCRWALKSYGVVEAINVTNAGHYHQWKLLFRHLLLGEESLSVLKVHERCQDSSKHTQGWDLYMHIFSIANKSASHDCNKKLEQSPWNISQRRIRGPSLILAQCKVNLWRPPLLWRD